jgi:hypothetical protein
MIPPILLIKRPAPSLLQVWNQQNKMIIKMLKLKIMKKPVQLLLPQLPRMIIHNHNQMTKVKQLLLWKILKEMP